MLTKEKLIELEPFFQQVKKLIAEGDDGKHIAALVGVPAISPLYGSVVGMVRRYLKNKVLIGINKDYTGNLRRFLVLHEASHVKLEHLSIAGFLNSDGAHSDFELFNDPFKRKLLIDTEREANICAALAVFDDWILDEMGITILQEIEDTKRSIHRMDKALSSLRFRWGTTHDPDVRRELRQNELEQNHYIDSLSRLHEILENNNNFTDIESIARSYGVPVACIQCFLEGKRILGYDVIPVQEIDWFSMLSPQELESYRQIESFDAC